MESSLIEQLSVVADDVLKNRNDQAAQTRFLAILAKMKHPASGLYLHALIPPVEYGQLLALQTVAANQNDPYIIEARKAVLNTPRIKVVSITLEDLTSGSEKIPNPELHAAGHLNYYLCENPFIDDALIDGVLDRMERKNRAYHRKLIDLGAIGAFLIAHTGHRVFTAVW